MKSMPIRNRSFLHGDEIRCAVCGRQVTPHQEKTCPRCGKRSVQRTGAARCEECHSLLLDGDMVCPLCGGKQRTVAEVRAIVPEKLTAFAHLLHEGQPSLSVAECRKRCRTVTPENPYRLTFAHNPEKIRPFLRAWRELGGTAAACLPRETSRRPVVLLRSYNTLREREYVRLLFEALQKSDRPAQSFGEAAVILHSVNGAQEPARLRFASDFDRIEAFVAAWRSLGGTAVRSPEHC